MGQHNWIYYESWSRDEVDGPMFHTWKCGNCFSSRTHTSIYYYLSDSDELLSKNFVTVLSCDEIRDINLIEKIHKT